MWSHRAATVLSVVAAPNSYTEIRTFLLITKKVEEGRSSAPRRRWLLVDPLISDVNVCRDGDLLAVANPR